jgi:hypothetical protein
MRSEELHIVSVTATASECETQQFTEGGEGGGYRKIVSKAESAFSGDTGEEKERGEKDKEHAAARGEREERAVPIRGRSQTEAYHWPASMSAMMLS